MEEREVGTPGEGETKQTTGATTKQGGGTWAELENKTKATWHWGNQGRLDLTVNKICGLCYCALQMI